MKRLIAYFVSGMRTASFVYLSLVLLAQFYSGITYPAPTTKNILALFLMSGIMGVLTLILERLEFLAYSMRVGVHLLATATILVLTYLFFGWGSALLSPLLWFFFLLIYGLIWLYQIWQTHKLTQRINQALEYKRKKTNH
ncbi:DUF3021 domain-containing protein [Streptococcus oralis]|uniref:DUF3021 domain-containing protein n=1 Tax=Streptococcus oralis TaxID=1303 RepID=UPI0022843D58|nr:DUF3021 domain-containing protein [Streptococcus oralis]MCY7067538.1 DUF3021 domain-containing protein [Streptococcus oralis]